MFDYIIDKLENAGFSDRPFRHVEIPDLFEPEHFEQIVNASEITLPRPGDDEALFEALFEAGYKVVPFPGCSTDWKAYIRWHRDGSSHRQSDVHPACEATGIVLRLTGPTSPILEEVSRFFASRRFNDALARKFGLELDGLAIDGGIQKYLSGYEISPHPDLRKKATTFMVNINPQGSSEDRDYHTHYLDLKAEYQYVKSLWKYNPAIERCWIPWDWCETVKQQRQNNSMVAFAPSDDTIHAVKASYDHLESQRTQLYGNLWHKAPQSTTRLDYAELDLPGLAASKVKADSAVAQVRQRVSRGVKTIIAPVKERLTQDQNVDSGRKQNY